MLQYIYMYIRYLCFLHFDIRCTTGKKACDDALRKLLLDNAVGDERPKMRPAREEDRFLVSRWVAVTLPEYRDSITEDMVPSHTCKVLWAIKPGDLSVELTQANLQFCFGAIRSAAPATKAEKPKVKGSPKKRRKVKRRKSQESSQASAEQEAET